MKILGVNGKPVKACCVFNYEGFEVSASTIFKPTHIAVFNHQDNEAKYDATSIPDAIEWIDDFLRSARL